MIKCELEPVAEFGQLLDTSGKKKFGRYHGSMFWDIPSYGSKRWVVAAKIKVNEPVDFEYATSATGKTIKKEGLELTITEHGIFIINGRKYDADELVTKLDSSVIRKYNRIIAINVDKDSKMGVITKAISTFKRLGFVKLAIITKQDHP